MTASLVALGVGVIVIAYLWFTGHPAIIDRGEGQPRTKLDGHSKYHALGGFGVALGVGLFDGWWLGLLVSVWLWSLVEIAQKNPRDRKGGYAEPSDFLMDALGASLAALLVWVIR